MQVQYSPYIFPLLVSSIIASFVAIYVWQRRATASGAMALALLALACAEWSLGYALEIAGANLPTKILWGKSQYIGIVTIPLLWMIFAYSYAAKSIQMTRRSVILLSIVPLITLILAFTNELHGLIWEDIRIHTVGTFSALEVTRGFWFWMNWMYSNTLLLLGTIFILQSFNRTKGLLRRQNILLLIAVLTPWFGNVLYVSGSSPIPNLDITPFAFTVSVVVFAWGIFSLKLVNLAPVARDLVVEKMPDGMIVLDAQGTIVDINPALQRALGVSASQAIGQSAKDLFSAWPSLVERYANTLEAQDEIVFGEGESQRWYELRMSPLVGSRDRLLGRVVTVRNITERKQTEERIRQMNAELERRRLGRDLHDSVTQVIFSMMQIAQSISPAWRRDPVDGEKRVDRLLELSKEALVEMRTLLAELRPAQDHDALRTEGLPAALARHISRLAQDSIHINLDTKGYVSQSPALEENLFRITQEALYNVVKHAHASRVQVTLRCEEQELCLKVHDNGVGLQAEHVGMGSPPSLPVPEASAGDHGFGILNMHERAASQGGGVRLISKPGKGTTVEVRIPNTRQV